MSALGGRLAATRRVIVAVLRNPALRRLLAAFLAFNAVEFGAWVAILLYAYDAIGPASVGVVALVQLVPFAIVAPVSAALGDRYPRQRVLGAAYLGMGVLFGLTGLGMLLAWPPLLVVAIAVLAGLSFTWARPTHNALLPGLARTAEDLTAANASTSIAEAGGALAGPLVAAAMLAATGPGAVLILLSSLVIIGALLVIGLRPAADVGGPDTPTAGPTDDTEGRAAQAIAGLRVLAREADARLIVGILAARSLMVGIVDILFVFVALELFGTGESGAAILSAAIGAGGIVGGAASFLLVGQARIAPILALSSIVWGGMVLVMGLTASGSLAPVLLVVGGTGLAVMDVAGRTLLQRAVRDEVLARVFGILEGLNYAALAVGSIIVPIVIALVGLQASIVVFAVLLPLIVGLAWRGLAGIDRRAVVPTRAIGLLRRLRLFEALDPPVLEALGRAATWITVPPGTVVIHEGDPGDRFYVLGSGAVRVTRGERHLRDLERVGEGFGEIALLRGVPRTATVTALVETSLLVLERAAFLSAVTYHPTATAEADRIATDRLDDRPTETMRID